MLFSRNSKLQVYSTWQLRILVVLYKHSCCTPVMQGYCSHVSKNVTSEYMGNLHVSHFTEKNSCKICLPQKIKTLLVQKFQKNLAKSLSNSQTGNRADERRMLELKISLTSFLSNWSKSLPLKQSIILTVSFSYLTQNVYLSTIDTAHFSLTHYYMLYCCAFENKDITHLVADIAKETRTQGNIHNNIHL